MSRANLIHQTNAKPRGKDQVISGRLAYKYLRLADRTFFPAVKHGILIPQMSKRLGNRTEYHFAIAYLDEVSKVLGKRQGKGVEVFTEAIIKKLAPINKEWDGKLNVDWAQDTKDTDRVMKKLAA